MARSVTISRAELLVPNHTQETTTKNSAAVWSVVGCIRLRSSGPAFWPFLVASSCSAPTHQKGTEDFCGPNTNQSMKPMMGACRNMMAAPARSRIFTFQ